MTYTHGHHDSVLQSHRRRAVANSAAYLLPHLAPGMHVVDVGCGPGTITLDLARLVGPDGQVIGVDSAPEAVEAAQTAAADTDLGWFLVPHAEVRCRTT
jgi:ubiquinone/menaquinone biosynthesis C-methylase UbiE